MTVRPPKGVRSAGNLARCFGRSQKERIGVVPIQDKHQGNKHMDAKKEVGGEGSAHRMEGEGGRLRKWWVFAWCLWESGL